MLSQEISSPKSCATACGRQFPRLKGLLIFVCIVAGVQFNNDALVSATNVIDDNKVLSFDLHPSTQLLQKATTEQNSGLRRRLRKQWWNHPKSNGVYATLPKHGMDHGLDLAPEDEVGLEDFHTHRHMSRYERILRSEQGLDLQQDWNGTYGNDSSIQRRLRKDGRLNSYQTAPLHQGYGTHYANIWIGTPTPQRVSVIVDTGSHVTALPCTGCQNCGEEHHTDPYYDPELSHSFRSLECDECYMGANCVYTFPNTPQQEEHCSFSQSYTEGSSWKAFQVEDIVYASGSNVVSSANPQDLQHAIPFMFGCQTSEAGLFVTQLANGIMGMSAYETTLAKQMYDKGKIDHNMFSLCFRHELFTSKDGVKAGFMTLGGVDKRLDSSPMVFAKNMARSGWYTVNVQNLYLSTEDDANRSNRVKDVIKIPIDVNEVNSGKGVIVDSGTTDTFLNIKLAASFGAVWKQVTGQDYAHSPLSLTSSQLHRLPTVLIQLEAYSKYPDPSLGAPDMIDGLVGSLDPSAPNDVLISIPPSHYMEYSPQTNQYTSRLYFTETSGGVIGANAMQGHNVLFDWENGRVGFAKSSCDYKEIEKQQQEGDLNHLAMSDNTADDDCVLSGPSLSSTCIESVDTSVCSVSPDSVLEGKETWTRVVKNTGDTPGTNCVDAVLLDAPHKGDNLSQVECDGNGLCFEYRPCTLNCSDTEVTAVKPVKSKKQQTLKQSGESCGENLWGACDYSCSQSKMKSVLMTDGICHEVSRETRPCHVGACGKSDPCKVPFIVHAVLVFEGVDIDLWNRMVDETLATALSSAVAANVNGKESLFEAGDVNVLDVSPWYGKDEKGRRDMKSKESLGVKVVLQVSIFNSNSVNNDSVNMVPDGAPFTDSLNGVVSKVRGRFQLQLEQPTARKCNESELYPLANSAVKVLEVLNGRQFMPCLVVAMKRLEVGGGNDLNSSPFGKIYNHDDLRKSGLEVMASWTIKTEWDNTNDFANISLDLAALFHFIKNFRLMGIVVGVLFCAWGIGMLCGCRVAKRNVGTIHRLSSFESSVIKTLRYLRTDSRLDRYKDTCVICDDGAENEGRNKSLEHIVGASESMTPEKSHQQSRAKGSYELIDLLAVQKHPRRTARKRWSM